MTHNPDQLKRLAEDLRCAKCRVRPRLAPLLQVVADHEERERVVAQCVPTQRIVVLTGDAG